MLCSREQEGMRVKYRKQLPRSGGSRWLLAGLGLDGSNVYDDNEKIKVIINK
jgi:hypothetical protein